MVRELLNITLATKMEFPLPPLPPFLALPGEPPIPWSRWHESFENFILAAGLADAREERRRALLVHNLGSEGQRIFSTLGPSPSYAECVTKLSGHFAAPQSTMLRRLFSDSAGSRRVSQSTTM